MTFFKFSKIRMLETGHNSAAWNMALDEVLLMNCANNNNNNNNNNNYHDSLPVLRIYGWKPHAISIGYFQSMEEEVNTKKCKETNIDIVRRITGGGAVLHESELTYSFITNIYPSNILESYNLICDPVIICINKLGFVNATFAPLNDIIVEGKKVSGNAQTRRNNALLQHGTILLDVDVEKMFSVLKVSSEKAKGKMINDVKKRVMGLNKSFEQVAYNLKESFREKFGAQIIVDNLTTDEMEKTKKLASEKYSSDLWNRRK